MACKYLKHPCLHPPQSYVWKKEIICCAAICLFLINTPILLPWRAPASPLFLPPSLSMHILLYDYLNGCQKNTVTRLIWAVRERREERERGPAILHTPFYRAGKWRVREKLLPWLPAGSFCPCVWRALAVPSLSKPWEGGEGKKVRGDGGDGCKEVRWGMSVVGGWSGGPAAKGGTAQGLVKIRGLLAGKRATKEQYWGLWWLISPS